MRNKLTNQFNVLSPVMLTGHVLMRNENDYLQLLFSEIPVNHFQVAALSFGKRFQCFRCRHNNLFARLPV